MPTLLTRSDPNRTPPMIAKQRICLNREKTQAVPADSKDAAFLLVGEGCEIHRDEAAKWGIVDGRLAPADPDAAAKAEQEAKAKAEADSKAKADAEAPGDPEPPRRHRRG